MILELRQYLLRPGQRDVLVDLFDRELVESQEALGMAILGQFRDLDRPDRFVWLRGFGDMPGRAEGLTTFYSGPVWKANSAAANATMLDVDDVLLLRPVNGDTGFPPADRPPVGRATPPGSAVLAAIHLRDRPFDDESVERLDREVRPVVTPLARFQTLYEENNFPALPVRAGEHAYVWFARFDDLAALDGCLARLDPSAHYLRLAPTARSSLR